MANKGKRTRAGGYQCLSRGSTKISCFDRKHFQEDAVGIGLLNFGWLSHTIGNGILSRHVKGLPLAVLMVLYQIKNFSTVISSFPSSRCTYYLTLTSKAHSWRDAIILLVKQSSFLSPYQPSLEIEREIYVLTKTCAC